MSQKEYQFWSRDDTDTMRSLIINGHTLESSRELFRSTFPTRSYDTLRKKYNREVRNIAKVRTAQDMSAVLDTPSPVEPTELLSSKVNYDIALEKAKVESRRWESQYRELVKRAASFERLEDFIKQSIVALSPVTVPKPFDIPSKERQPMTMVLDIGDIHWGDKVTPETIMYLGDYDRNMARARIAYLIKEALLIKKHIVGHRFDKINIHLLGDIVSGYIHDELRQSGDGKIIDWVVEAALCLSLAILDLAREFPIVEVYGVAGNHARLDKRLNFKEDAFNNWDYMVYMHMSALLANQPNVKLHFPRSYFVLADVNGFKSLLIHGQFINGYNSLPYYGVVRTATNLSDLINLQHIVRNVYGFSNEDIAHILSNSFRYIEMGHFHTSSILCTSSVEIIMNGSVVGNSEYNTTKMALGQDPKQWLLLAHPERGYTGCYQINLRDATRDMGERYAGSSDKLIGENFKDLAKKNREGPVAISK